MLNHTLLRELRQRRRLTQLALANKAGISRQYLIELESGRSGKSPTEGVVCRLAAALGTTAARLIEEEP
jgi:transcriptional regulator with XRE-family HTH domain